MFIEILFKMLLFKGGVLIYTKHCIGILNIPKTIPKLFPLHKHLEKCAIGFQHPLLYHDFL